MVDFTNIIKYLHVAADSVYSTSTEGLPVEGAPELVGPGGKALIICVILFNGDDVGCISVINIRNLHDRTCPW